jgi:hypothetical protein
VASERRQITLKAVERKKQVPISRDSDDTKGSWTTFRLVSRGPPTTAADRMAHRLVRTLERNPDGTQGILLQLGYLTGVPQRLAQSPVLRDSVELFCAAWVGYTQRGQGRGLPGGIMSLNQYGKTLRSLQSAIGSAENALTVETLAAMMLLERTESYFGRGQLPAAHMRGIAMLVEKKGPPNLKDPLDMMLANNARDLLQGLWVLEGRKNFLETPEWKAALQICQAEAFTSSQLKAFTRNDLDVLLECHDAWPEWLKTLTHIRHHPYASDTDKLSAILIYELEKMQLDLKHIIASVKANALEQGSMAETPATSPHSITPTIYDFTSVEMAQMFGNTHMLRIIVLRMMANLTGSYGSIDHVKMAEYRAVCADVWKFGPYLMGLDSVVAVALTFPYYLTYEAAGPREKESIFEMLEHADSYVQRWPREKAHKELAVARLCSHIFGSSFTIPSLSYKSSSPAASPMMEVAV